MQELAGYLSGYCGVVIAVIVTVTAVAAANVLLDAAVGKRECRAWRERFGK